MDGVREVSKNDLLQLLNDSSVKVINVLSQQAYDNLHIAGSIWIPFDRLEEGGWKELSGFRVITYCSSIDCGASETAAAILIEHGIEAMAYRGGMKEWVDSGLPVEGKLSPENYGKAGKC